MTRTLLLLATLMLCGIGIAESQATPITQTVTVGTKEWAQVNLFTGLSWDDINLVCPAGVCGASTLNGFDMDGWTWASQAEVGDDLFMPFTTHPGGVATDTESGDKFSPWLAQTGFNVTDAVTTQFEKISFVAGWTSDLNHPGFGGVAQASLSEKLAGVLTRTQTVFDTNVEFPQGTRDSPGLGAWFARSAPIPEPSTLALLGLSFGVMGWKRRRAS